jgi:predicted transcriptional regulator
VTVDDNTPVDEVVRIMETHRIKRLPVMRENRMVGIISRENLMHALLRSIHKSTALTKQKEAERGRLAELEREAWLHRTRT